MTTLVRKDRIVDALAQEFAAIDELLSGLDEAQWTAPSPCPGWDVRANVAHIIGTESMLAGIPNPDVAVDRDALPHVRNDIGAFNEAWVVALADVPTDELLERFRAITASRLEALRAMEITEVGFRSWFDNAREGIFRSSADGRLLRANRALARLNGYDTPEELIAAVRDISAEWYVDPQRRAEYLALIERDGEVVAFESEIWRHRTRERIWVSENSRAVRDLDGSILYLEGTVVEIRTDD